jgi:hypothetical protein
MSTKIPFTYEYNIQGTTTKGESIADNGQASTFLKLQGKNSYCEEVDILSEALSFAIRCFNDSKIEKEGRQLAAVTVSIKNIQYQ